MKVYLQILSGLTLLLGAGCASSQSLYAEPPVPVATNIVTTNVAPMDQLLAPIALYPDALVAIILPASTASSDIVLAARFLSGDNRPEAIEDQPWDDSVKALTHYPDVVRWMDENLAWTQQLGAAYLDQPQEVMAAIQRNRLRARTSGILVDTPQQQVIIEDGYVRIVPAQADVIYVPRYDPQIVYIEQPVYYSPDPWLSFGIGFGVGSWLSYDCDWRSRSIWVNHNRDRWQDHRDWRFPDHHRPGYVSHSPGWNQWRPTPGRPRPYPGRFDNNPRRNHPQPRPIVGAPNYDPRRSRERFAEREARAGNERPDRDRTRGRNDVSPITNPVIAPPQNSTLGPGQPLVSSPADRGQNRPDQHRNDGNNQRRRVPGDPARNDGRASSPVVRTEQTPVPAVTNPTPSTAVSSSTTTVVNPPQTRRPAVPNPQMRRIQPGRGSAERSAEVRPTIPRPTTPNASQNNQRREHSAPAVSNPVAQQAVPASPPVVRVPPPSRQPEMMRPAPSLPRVERSVAPTPQPQPQPQPQPAARVAPPAPASRQDGNSSNRRTDRSDRTDRDQR